MELRVSGIILLFILLFTHPQLIAGDTNQAQGYDDIKNTLTLLNKLKISGYMQGQFQYGQKDAALTVGEVNENPDKSFNRIGVRRGRLKFVYEEGIAGGVFQIDLTEKGIGLKDAYFNLKDPWIKTNALRAGIFDRPFGYEITYSSGLRESPERSKVFRTLFPDERDMGAMLILQAPKTSPFHFIKVQGGLFAGNGIKKETDNRKDFIGQLILSPYNGSDIRVGLGASYYNGGVYQGTDSVYSMNGKEFVLNNNPKNKGKFAKRDYIGFDAQLVLKSLLGRSQLRAEYLFGSQPGTQNSTNSPNGGLPVDNTYLRNFTGGYIMLVHDIFTLPLAAVVKYDWYDPNTKVSGSYIGLNGTGKADAKQKTWG